MSTKKSIAKNSPKVEIVAAEAVETVVVETVETVAAEAEVETIEAVAEVAAPKAKKEKVVKEKVAKVAKEKPVKVSPSVVEILKVLYGIKDVNVIDVTDKVVIGGKVNNRIAGSDPVKNKKKKVYVTALLDGVEQETIFNEGKELVW